MSRSNYNKMLLASLILTSIRAGAAGVCIACPPGHICPAGGVPVLGGGANHILRRTSAGMEWVDLYSVRGFQGVKGVQGTVGAQGLDGHVGPSGSTGTIAGFDLTEHVSLEEFREATSIGCTGLRERNWSTTRHGRCGRPPFPNPSAPGLFRHDCECREQLVVAPGCFSRPATMSFNSNYLPPVDWDCDSSCDTSCRIHSSWISSGNWGWYPDR